MVISQNFKIIGSGSHLPKTQLSCDDIDERTGQPVGWTRSNVGVLSRHECVKPETIITMGRQAIELAMKNADIPWSEIDYIIDCSTSKYRPIPCNAVHVQQAIGEAARSIPCVDLQSTCLGSILAIHTANAMFGTGAFRNILIVASEAGLAGVNWSDPITAGLVGDGAAALVLQHRPVEHPLGFAHETFSQHLELCRVDGGGHYLPVFEYEPSRKADYCFTMDGPAVFKVAIQHLPPMVQRLREDFMKAIPGGPTDFHVVPHQASPKALRNARRLLGFPRDRFHIAIDQIGNLAAASIPMMVDQLRRNQMINSGELVMLLGTSAGYSQAGLLFQM